MTGANFDDVVARPGLVVLDYSARWCGPCKQFAPIFAAAAETRTAITFGAIDTDDDPELAVRCDVRAQPTIVVFRDGAMVYKQVGAVSASKFDALLDRLDAARSTT